MYVSSIRPLTHNEIELVSAGDSVTHAAFIAAGGAIGGAIGARAGEMTGSEFGALVGGAVCSPGGPEASAACAAIGGWAGLSLGDVSGRDAGAAAGAALAEDIWQSVFGDDNAAGNQNMAYDESQAQPFIDNLTYDSADGTWSDSEFGNGASWEASSEGDGAWGDPYSGFDADTGSDFVDTGSVEYS